MFSLHSLLLAWVLLLPSSQGFCQMNQWEGISMTYFFQPVEQAPVLTSRLDRVTFDPKSKRIAVRENWSTEKGTYDKWVIQDYAKGELYSVEGGVCTRTALRETWDQACVSSNFNLTFSPPAWLGLMGPNIQTLFLFEHGYAVQGSNLFTATSGGMPAYTHVYAAGSERSILYGNINRNISDPSVLIPPPSCPSPLASLLL